MRVSEVAVTVWRDPAFWADLNEIAAREGLRLSDIQIHPDTPPGYRYAVVTLRHVPTNVCYRLEIGDDAFVAAPGEYSIFVGGYFRRALEHLGAGVRERVIAELSRRSETTAPNYAEELSAAMSLGGFNVPPPPPPPQARRGREGAPFYGRYEFTGDNSSKYWSIERLPGGDALASWGRIGAERPQGRQVLTEAEAARRVKDKLRKGYVKVGGVAAPVPVAPESKPVELAAPKLGVRKIDY